jgi:phosphohistidine phosphatase SixA
MRLVLVRHAQAAPAGSGTADAERPLTPAGAAQLGDAARGLARLDLGIRRIVSSPARRCRESAAIVAHALGVETVQALPDLALGAPVDAAVDQLLRPGVPTLAVGHAPDLGLIAAELLGGPAALHFDVGGAAGLEVEPNGRRAALVWLLPGSVLVALGVPQR